MTPSKEKKFRLFANCIPVRGACRSAIFDLQREDYNLIPNALYNRLTEQDNHSRASFLKTGCAEEKAILNSYLDFLESNEYIFWDTEETLSHFPPLRLEWDFPGEVISAVIDLPSDGMVNQRIEKLESLGCQNLVFRFLGEVDLTSMASVWSLLQASSISNIIILGKYEKRFVNKEWLSRISLSKRVITVLFQVSEARGKDITELMSISEKIAFLDKEMFDLDSMYLDIRARGFLANIRLFSEAFTYNPYFNRKIFVGQNGEITFSQTGRPVGKLLEMSSPIDLEKYPEAEVWRIPKSKIDVCKDCEFRFVCIDSRLPVRHKDGSGYYFQDECPYNPYIAKWEGEDGYHSIAEGAIETDRVS